MPAWGDFGAIRVAAASAGSWAVLYRCRRAFSSDARLLAAVRVVDSTGLWSGVRSSPRSGVRAWVERYGDGHGMPHGGAGRVLTHGRWQTKGAGPTVLVDAAIRQADPWHAHGLLPLEVALQELIWSRVFGAFLPAGCVPVVGLVAPGGTCPVQTDDGLPSRAPRALLLREAVLRPAHLLPAPAFEARRPAGWPSETQRMARAYGRFWAACVEPLTGSAAPTLDNLLQWRRVLVSRVAHQCAAAQVRRVMHGSLNASNMAFDGRWLDFGTAVGLPDYGNSKGYGYPRRFATLWEEPSGAAAALLHWEAVIGQHVLGEAARSVWRSEDTRSGFESAHRQALAHEALLVAGIPEDALPAAEAATVARTLGPALVAVMREGNQQRIEPRSPDMKSIGRDGLADVLGALSQSRSSADAARRLAAAAVPEHLVPALAKGLGTLRQAWQHHRGHPTDAGLHGLNALLWLGAERARDARADLTLGAFRSLCRRVAQRALRRGQGAQELSALVAAVDNRARAVFAPPSLHEAWAGNGPRGERLGYDTESGTWFQQRGKRREPRPELALALAGGQLAPDRGDLRDAG